MKVNSKESKNERVNQLHHQHTLSHHPCEDMSKHILSGWGDRLLKILDSNKENIYESCGRAHY